MTKRYRVVSKCFAGRDVYLQINSGWASYSQCRAIIRDKYGHYPPWAFVSSISNIHKLERMYLT